MWLDLKSGPMGALSKLLDDPIQFDTASYLAQALPSKSSQYQENLRNVCRIFETQKAHSLKIISKALYQLEVESSPIASTQDSSFNTRFLSKMSSQLLSTDIDAKRELHVCELLNQQLDRVIERYRLKNRGYKQPASAELFELLTFFWLSENLYMVFVGIAKCEIQYDGALLFSPLSNKSRKHLMRKWIANHWESVSNKSNIAYFDYIDEGANITLSVKILLSSLAENLRDKIFSIPTGKLPENILSLPFYKLIDGYCMLISSLLWGKMKAKREFLSMSDLLDIGVQPTIIDSLSEYMLNALATDKIITIDNDKVSLITTSISYQSRFIIKSVFDNLTDKEKGHIGNIFGDIFEQSIKLKLGKLNSEKYIVYPGITYQESLHGDNILDVDLIVKDVRRKKYLFLQVKYILAGGIAYLAGDNWYSRKSKKTIQKGISQLNSAKYLLEIEQLQASLNALNIFDCTLENSELIVVHNVCNLDFQLDQSGVALYEWNTFRNLLDDGRCSYGQTREGYPKEWRYHEGLEVENPDLVIEVLLKNSPICLITGANNIANTFELETERYINGRRICSKGLGL